MNTGNTIKSLGWTALLGLALAFSSGGTFAHGDHSNPGGGHGELNPELLRDVADARRATAAFHNHSVAVEAGWDWQASPCEETAAGGMGQHHINFDLLIADGLVDVTLPQALLYEPQKNGRLRLVGVEYIVPSLFVGPDDDPPVLFGQQFHFNNFIQAWTLHAWIWRHNPSGMFANWNPNVSCEFD